jgi:hypothetical protein
VRQRLFEYRAIPNTLFVRAGEIEFAGGSSADRAAPAAPDPVAPM